VRQNILTNPDFPQHSPKAQEFKKCHHQFPSPHKQLFSYKSQKPAKQVVNISMSLTNLIAIVLVSKYTLGTSEYSYGENAWHKKEAFLPFVLELNINTTKQKHGFRIKQQHKEIHVNIALKQWKKLGAIWTWVVYFLLSGATRITISLFYEVARAWFSFGKISGDYICNDERRWLTIMKILGMY
jgi:hypothetical protein